MITIVISRQKPNRYKQLWQAARIRRCLIRLQEIVLGFVQNHMAAQGLRHVRTRRTEGKNEEADLLTAVRAAALR
jgi:hypothetical protein